MRNHGTDPRRRFKVMRERVEAIKEIWTKDEAEYHGEFVDFDPIWSWPKPLQQPHPPVVVGGSGPRVIDRVLRYGDEWFPNRMESMEALKERIEQLRERADRRVPVSFFGAKPEARTVESLAGAGVDRVIFYVPADASPGLVDGLLDEYAALR
jgi:alkanesulfonate monooxygenase SsuD/methylene tetrahydromethanopterin reductase-like flavin-dependent oxidoreductase (luciferase family)